LPLPVGQIDGRGETSTFRKAAQVAGLHRTRLEIWVVRQNVAGDRRMCGGIVKLYVGEQCGEAIPAFQEAIRLNPNSAEAHLELAKTELTVGRVSDAIVELEEALHLSPGNVQARRLLSQAYRRAGDAKRAVQYAETSAEAPPGTEGDLVGDFVLPEWQMPEQSKQD
jgi:Flp pilus assembly protein TadD